MEKDTPASGRTWSARLQQERDYTRAVIDTASSMIVVTEQDGTVIAANPATAELTGFTEAELLGHRFWDVLMADPERDEIAAAFAGPEPIPSSGETMLLTRDLQHKRVEFSTAAHRASPDAPLYYVLSATDVTDARENAGLVSHLLRSASATAFVGTDLEGRITLFNTGAESLLGIDAEAATGRDFVDFLGAGPDGVRRFADLVADVEQTRPPTTDLTWLPHGRAPVEVSMTTNAVRNTFGHLIGYLFVATDVTDTRRSQEILVRALAREREVVARLRDLDRAKDDFVSTVSHELRTPMSSIIGSAEMLADGMLGDLEPEQAAMVGVIARNGDRLLALAEDLLVLASFDPEQWRDQRVRVPLGQVVLESRAAVAASLTHRDLDVLVSVPDEPVDVLGDPVHLERALTNLLTNAVKFTPDGGRIELGLSVAAGERAAVVRVHDTGLGIAESELDAVFGRFYRAPQAQERAIPGTGLGLAIVKAIVEAHDGRIEVRSRSGEGTTFTLRLPLA